MSAWFGKNLGDAMLAPEELGRIEAAFAAECGRGGCPADAAVFVRHESEGRLHCEVHVYFSPAAAAVAAAVDADPCARPSPHDLSQLAGAPGAWSLLFGPGTG